MAASRAFRCLIVVIAIMASGPDDVGAFKDNDFKKCSDSAFCTRLRGKKGDVYALDSHSLDVNGSKLTARVVNEGSKAEFGLTLTAYKGIVRLHIDEDPAKQRFQVPTVLREDLAAQEVAWGKQTKALLGGSTSLNLGEGVTVALSHKPLGVTVVVGGQPAVVFNGEHMFAFEHLREKQDGDAAGMWEETFKSHTDSKPKGPEAISVDLSFPGAHHVFGLPEHASNLSLHATTGEVGKESGEPYRLYNLDVFEYVDDSTFGLYGAVPLLLAHKAGLTIGAFWLNAAEMYVDVAKPASGASTQWMAESGVLDLFLLLGPSPADVSAQYAALTGGTAMPQMFGLGYHQCRWNYNDEADVAAVDAGFDAHDIPYDVIWLDIEHTDGKRYLTWDAKTFPHPEKMQNDIASRGRKVVTIVDPHIKRDDDYKVFKTAEDKNCYVKTKEGKVYDGWCWPGSSSYLDVMNPEVREWWATNFLPGAYPGATKHLYIWNDMNEPSVFNGPEITFPKDLVHYGDAEHRDVHNVYGKLYHEATAQGLIKRGEVEYGADGDRPFVLSRAFYAGTQTVGPIWTGDNAAEWGHLQVSIPMVLSVNLAGIAFSGADVGGFFGNPSAELLTRWYQLGTYYPFFRGHAHLETARREPWLFGEPTTTHIRDAIRARYALLPYLYTLFRHAHLSGQPVMRPLWFEFPETEALFGLQDQFMLGAALLVAPVLQPGAASRPLLLPATSNWFDASTGEAVATDGSAQEVAVTMESVPSYLRGGHITARKDRARRSTAAMHADPVTLVIALNSSGSAEGDLYLDDGHSFAFQRGACAHRHLRYKDGILSSSAYGAPAGDTAPSSYQTVSVIERIVLLGLPGGPSGWQVSLVSSGGAFEAAPGPLHLRTGALNTALVVRKPSLSLTEAWTVEFVRHQTE